MQLKHKSWVFYGLLLAILLSGISTPLTSQDDIILTVAVPEWQRDVYRRDVFDDFEAAHPGVSVELVNQPTDSFFGSAAYVEDLDEFFESVNAFVSSGDVLAVSDYSMPVEATRAGYFLDMSPLIEGDPSFDVNDFFPAIWESYQWDNGIWAIPISANVELLTYRKEAFDEAGLPYPDDTWTFDELMNAARQLTVYDAEGNVEIPGFFGFSTVDMIYSAVGQRFVDETTFPVQPGFTDPAIVEFAEQWVELQEEGVIGTPSGAVDFETIPIMTNGAFRLRQGDSDEFGGLLFPGGYAGIQTNAFAISAGTQYPELAYELIKFMSSDIDIVNSDFGDSPARQSLVGVESEEDQFFFGTEYSAEAQELIDRAIANGIGVSDLLFGEYVNQAFFQLQEEGVDAATALQEAETRALEVMAEAEARRGNTIITVEQPDIAPELAEGEIALKFRVNAIISPLPNREGWEALVDEFIANDPNVRHIELLTGFGGPDPEPADCYYDTFTDVSQLNVENLTMLSLDPFIDADPNFSEDDFIASTLDKMRLEGRTWGLPIVIQPSVLWYNADLFEQAGLPMPEGGWTIEQFTEALPLLDSVIEEDIAAFIPEDGSANHLLILMAAFGGLPYDYSTSPPTPTLTDSITLDAMRQVLNLAKDGFIHYEALGDNFGGGSFGGQDTALYTDSLSTVSYRIRVRSGEFETSEPFPYYLTTYPVGFEYTPVAYSVSGAYIEQDTQHPEACYRWISTVAQHPELFSAMPARRSFINSPELSAAQGPDIIETYHMIDEMLQAPNLVTLPDQFNSGFQWSFIEQQWINRMFDQYVLEDAELEPIAEQIQQDIMTFRECQEGVPDFTEDMTQEELIAISRQSADCAISIDPSMSEFFFFPEDEDE